MVDYDYVFLKSNITVRVLIPIPDGTDREMLAQDPHRMCMIAFSRKERLPEDLHQAMIMWSFHPDFSYCAKIYIEFLDFLDSMKPKNSSFSLFGFLGIGNRLKSDSRSLATFCEILASLLTRLFSTIQSRPKDDHNKDVRTHGFSPLSNN